MINPQRVDHFSISLPNTDDASTQYPCIIEYPKSFDTNEMSRAVVLYSGGLMADIDWSVPGSIEHQGSTVQLTISGKDTRDGLTLAQALLDSGFIVVRYSSVPEGKLITNAQPIAFPETVQLAQLLWDEAIARTGLPPSQVGVVGHSMGATRGVLTSNGQAGAYVLLAGAYITPTMQTPGSLSQEAIARNEAGSGQDFDQSGETVGWELAASHAIENNLTQTHEALVNNGVEFDWPSDLLINNQSPVCALWGGLDPISYHGPVLEHFYLEHNVPQDRFQNVYFPTLGHQLCEEVDGLIGPIDSEVVQRVVSWLDRTIPVDQ